MESKAAKGMVHYQSKGNFHAKRSIAIILSQKLVQRNRKNLENVLELRNKRTCQQNTGKETR